MLVYWSRRLGTLVEEYLELEGLIVQSGPILATHLEVVGLGV